MYTLAQSQHVQSTTHKQDAAARLSQEIAQVQETNKGLMEELAALKSAQGSKSPSSDMLSPEDMAKLHRVASVNSKQRKEISSLQAKLEAQQSAMEWVGVYLLL